MGNSSSTLRRGDNAVLYAVMAGMAITAMAVLMALDRSGAAIRHDDVGDPAVNLPAFVAVALGGWTLMAVAMKRAKWVKDTLSSESLG